LGSRDVGKLRCESLRRSGGRSSFREKWFLRTILCKMNCRKTNRAARPPFFQRGTTATPGAGAPAPPAAGGKGGSARRMSASPQFPVCRAGSGTGRCAAGRVAHLARSSRYPPSFPAIFSHGNPEETAKLTRKMNLTSQHNNRKLSNYEACLGRTEARQTGMMPRQGTGCRVGATWITDPLIVSQNVS